MRRQKAVRTDGEETLIQQDSCEPKVLVLFVVK